jgi:hypothetical protein
MEPKRGLGIRHGTLRLVRNRPEIRAIDIGLRIIRGDLDGLIEIVLGLIEIALKREGEAALRIGGRQFRAARLPGVNDGRTTLHPVFALGSLAELLRIGGLRLRHSILEGDNENNRRHQRQSSRERHGQSPRTRSFLWRVVDQLPKPLVI